MVGVRFETADGPVEVGARGGVVLATGGFEWDPRAGARVPPRPDRALGLGARPTPATACGWRCASAPRSATCARRGGCRSIDVPVDGPDGRPGWSTASAPGRTASWSTSGAGGSPTRRPTTTPSAPPSTSIDVTQLRLRQPAVLAGVRPALPDARTARRVQGGDGPTPDWVIEAPTIAELAAAIGVPAPTRSRPPSRGGTSSPRAARTPTSAAARARTTGGGATRAWATGRRRRSARSTRRRSTRCRCTAVSSAPRAARAPTANGQVLDVDGHPIAGLYAAGNVMALGHGDDLRRRRRHARPGDGVRLPRRPPRGAGESEAASYDGGSTQGRPGHRCGQRHGPGDSAAFAAAGGAGRRSPTSPSTTASRPRADPRQRAARRCSHAPTCPTPPIAVTKCRCPSSIPSSSRIGCGRFC